MAGFFWESVMRLCSIEGCGKKHYGKGFCSKHHKRFSIHGDPMPDKKPAGGSMPGRFWNKVKKSDGCWIWTAARYTQGYGKFHPGGTGNQPVPAHRISWELANGKIPEGLHVLHKCDVRNCVNPDHLFIGTHKDNMDDMIGKGRSKLSRGCGTGEDHPCHRLTWKQALEIRNLADLGHDYAGIAHEYGVSKSLVSLIKRNQRWKTENNPLIS